MEDYMEEDEFYASRDKLLARLRKAERILALPEKKQSEVVSDAGLMMEVGYNYYEMDHIAKWDAYFVEDYALGHLPRKYLGGPKDFERMGKNLIVLMEWLHEEKLVKNGKKLVKTMREVAPEMAEAAKDDSSWGLSKGIFSQAMGQGVDLSDQGQLDAFIQSFNNQSFEERLAQTGPPPRVKATGLDPFLHLGRNDRVDVRDPETGEVQKGVKFKFVEAGLRGGNLELVKT